jgi:hypothetical protein
MSEATKLSSRSIAASMRSNDGFDISEPSQEPGGYPIALYVISNIR